MRWISQLRRNKQLIYLLAINLFLFLLGVGKEYFNTVNVIWPQRPNPEFWTIYLLLWPCTNLFMFSLKTHLPKAHVNNGTILHNALDWVKKIKQKETYSVKHSVIHCQKKMCVFKGRTDWRSTLKGTSLYLIYPSKVGSSSFRVHISVDSMIVICSFLGVITCTAQ